MNKTTKRTALPKRPAPSDSPKQAPGKMQGVRSTTKNQRY